jgi:hypothetical protein
MAAASGKAVFDDTALSLRDQSTLDRLRAGRNGLLEDDAERGALKVLRRRMQTNTRNVYILHYLVDEGEILCDILVDGTTVVHMEIPLANEQAEIVFEPMTLATFRKQNSKVSRIDRHRLELALELAQTEGVSHE